jgi:activator of HSP90 ATPase
MTLITRTQVIRRPVEEVFATVIDGGNFAAWNPTIKASRRLDDGEIGEGTQFEWQLRGFGNVIQELQEFERNERVRIVPQLASLSGGHRFRFTADGESTRIDHELEMNPRGIFRLLAPMVARTGRRNLRDTAAALQRHLENASR